MNDEEEEDREVHIRVEKLEIEENNVDSEEKRKSRNAVVSNS